MRELTRTDVQNVGGACTTMMVATEVEVYHQQYRRVVGDDGLITLEDVSWTEWVTEYRDQWVSCGKNCDELPVDRQ
jgi:hypothetical protein